MVFLVLRVRSVFRLKAAIFLYVGITFTWSGVMHLCFPAFTADDIGWANSPFQFEVGLVNWSVAMLGFMAFFRYQHYFWLAVILSLAIFSAGAGIGHIDQWIAHADHSRSNSGAILYVDILAPLFMLLLWSRCKE